MNDEQARLEQAKTLIEQKQYAAAREILQSMSTNPTAHKWLVQVEAALARQNAPLPSEEEIAQRMKAARDLIQAGEFAEARNMLRPIENAPAAQEWIERLDQRLEAKAESTAATAADAAAEAAAKVKAKADAEARAKADAAARSQLLKANNKPSRLETAGPAALGSVVKAMSGQGIDPRLGGTALGLAAVAGLLAALLDGVLGMPGSFMPFALGWGVALLVGPAYAIMRQRVDRGAWIMALAAGAVALLFWFILSQITAGEANAADGDFTARDIHAYWFEEEVTLPKALWSGAILGLLGLGWYALLPRVPAMGERVVKFTGEKMGSLSKRGG